MKGKKNVAARIRLSTQLAFLLLIVLISLNHNLSSYGIQIPLVGSASLHAICPFGGVVSVYQFVTLGSLVQKVHEASLVLMGIVFFLAILAGPAFCGWVCPLGTVEELMGKVGRRIFKKTYNAFVPPVWDKYLRYLRYGVLAWVVYTTAMTMQLVFVEVDPYYALFNFWTGEVSLTAMGILAATLIGSLFIERPFCKYLCPYGALLGLFNKVRVFTIQRNPATCINCKACDRACPMNITVSTADHVRDTQCITCLKCTSEVACPVSETVELMVGRFTAQPADAPSAGPDQSQGSGVEKMRAKSGVQTANREVVK